MHKQKNSNPLAELKGNRESRYYRKRKGIREVLVFLNAFVEPKRYPII